MQAESRHRSAISGADTKDMCPCEKSGARLIRRVFPATMRRFAWRLCAYINMIRYMGLSRRVSSTRFVCFPTSLHLRDCCSYFCLTPCCDMHVMNHRQKSFYCRASSSTGVQFHVSNQKRKKMLWPKTLYDAQRNAGRVKANDRSRHDGASPKEGDAHTSEAENQRRVLGTKCMG